jgi:hypothetical protein
MKFALMYNDSLRRRRVMKKLIFLVPIIILIVGCTSIEKMYTGKRIAVEPEYYDEDPGYEYYEPYPYYYSPYFSAGFFSPYSWMGLGWWNPFYYYGMYGWYSGYYNPYYWGYFGYPYYSRGGSIINKRQLRKGTTTRTGRTVRVPSVTKGRSGGSRTSGIRSGTTRSRSGGTRSGTVRKGTRSSGTRSGTVRSGSSGRTTSRSSGSRGSSGKVRKK